MKVKSVPSSWLERDGRRLDCNPYMSGGLEASVAIDSLGKHARANGSVRRLLLRERCGHV